MGIATPENAEAISEQTEVAALVATDMLLGQHASGELIHIKGLNLNAASALEATHASDSDTADSATHADDSTHADAADTVAGVDPVNGNAGTYGTASVSSNSTWLIPKGTYIFTCATNLMWLRVKDSGSSFYGWVALSGLVISDGVNFQVYNSDSSARSVYYRKLA